MWCSHAGSELSVLHSLLSGFAMATKPGTRRMEKRAAKKVRRSLAAQTAFALSSHSVCLSFSSSATPPQAKKKRASIKNMLRSNERALAKARHTCARCAVATTSPLALLTAASERQTTDPGAKAALQAAREKLLKQQHEIKKVKLEEKYARKYGKVRFFGASSMHSLFSAARFFLPLTTVVACSERKRIMKARRKLNREIEAQGWVRVSFLCMALSACG